MSHPVHNSSNSNNGGIAGSFVAIGIGAFKGWVDIQNIVEASILSAIGAIVGFILNLFLKWAEKKIRAKWFKNS